MREIERCPLNKEERQKYCLCETCLFVKQCLEEIDDQIRGSDDAKNITKKAKKQSK